MTTILRFTFLVGVFFFFCAGLPALRAAELSRQPHVEAALGSEQTSFQPGATATVALRLRMEEHWHTYWQNPGDSGLPTTIEWSLPPGFSAGPIQWPAPRKLPLSELVNYGYEGEVHLLVEIAVPADAPVDREVELKAKVDWLVCKESCIPGGAELTLRRPVRAGPPSIDPAFGPAVASARAALPRAGDEWVFSATATSDGYRLRGRPKTQKAARPNEVYFFSSDAETLNPSAPQTFSADGDGFSLTLPRSSYAARPAETLRGVLAATAGSWSAQGPLPAVALEVAVEGATAAIPAGSAVAGTTAMGGGKTSAAPASLLASLGLAFLGGLLLNLMPCVFPVLSIKILGFVRQAGGDRREIARHGWHFTAGVLASFWALAGLLLALRAAGRGVGWGFQLQEPAFVAGLVGILFLCGLMLLGVFEIGGGLVSLASNLQAPRRGGGGNGAFFNGVLATVLATPCTAPFMGTALGAAAQLPAVQAWLIFTALGLGMAAPSLLLSLVPGWLRFLPKPGAWMDAFKQAMAFPLFATVVWLLWVLGLQVGADGLAWILGALVLLGAGAWVRGRWSVPSATRAARRTATILQLAVLVGAFLLAHRAVRAENAASSGAAPSLPSEDAGWVAYDPARLAALRAEGKPVFLDFTAAWCLTCKVNERTVLSADSVRRAFAEKGVVLMKADWTRRDPVIAQALAAHGKIGVPLYVLHGPGAGVPVLVSDYVTPQLLRDALGRLP